MIVPGIAGMAVMSTTFTALAFNMTFLREQGVLKRIRGTPMPGDLLPARDRRQRGHEHRGADRDHHGRGPRCSSAPAGRATGSSWSCSSPPASICFASLGVAFSHAIPNFDSAPAYVNAVFLPVIFISGVFYDAAKAPGFLKGIAQALPLKHLIDGLSGAMVKGTSIGDEHQRARRDRRLGACSGSRFAVRGFSWEQRRS